ncbi:hypothetical protein E2320_002447 [Naja naja]|nr:hypothetical protein E2320_002447 [Naja naja]
MQILTQQGIPLQLQPPASPAQAELPVSATLTPKSASCLLQRFTAESDKMETFLAQCDVFISIPPEEFTTGRSRISIILIALQIESAKQCIYQFHQDNNSVRAYIENFRLISANLD